MLNQSVYSRKLIRKPKTTSSTLAVEETVETAKAHMKKPYVSLLFYKKTGFPSFQFKVRPSSFVYIDNNELHFYLTLST
jgi:hypothetical protein